MKSERKRDMKQNEKKRKRVFALLTLCVLIISMSGNVFAAEPVDEEMPYFIINGEVIVNYGENYINEETGEYFIWHTNPNERSIAKSFSFKVRYGITSSKFTIDSSSVEISCNANVVNDAGDIISGFNGTPYTVQLTGIFTRKLEFSVGGTQTGTISGLSKGGNYSVGVSVDSDDLPTYPFTHYLEGTGTVKNL